MEHLYGVKMSKYNNFSLLEFNNQIIYDILSDRDSVLDNIMKKVLEQHPYAITPPSKDGGRWQTFYKDSSGKRKNIKASTKEELVKKLIKIYSTNKYLDKMTFEQLFDEWLPYKRTITSSPNTIKRHIQHYNKYFRTSKLNSMRISSIDELTLEEICNTLIKDHNLSNKEWTNIKGIIKGMFEYALRKKYISVNPVPNIHINVKYRQVVKKPAKTQIFNTDELKQLNDYLDMMYKETEDTAFLCVKLNFYLGLRVGELVTIRWEDIDDSQIHIVREEIRNQETNTYEVVDHTKTHTDRYIDIPNKAMEIFNLIPRTNEYIFVRDGNRLHTRQIAYILEKYAERQSIAVKSSHKIRKTYASILSNSVPIDCIREMLGHSGLQTAYSYIYNPLTEQQTHQLINNAFS